LPDRDFFYRILFALYPNTVEELLRQAHQARKVPAKNLQEEQWAVNIRPEWIENLLLHDFTSSE